MNKNEIVIDVRTKKEFKNKKLISQSINIPLDELVNNIQFLKQFDKIKLICVSGVRSKMAEDILEDNDIFTSEVLFL